MTDLLEKIKKEFTINGMLNKRYFHTIGVIEMAYKLNDIHNLQLDENQITLAAGFHDIAKFLPKEKQYQILKEHYPNLIDELIEYPDVWHSFVGAIYAQEKYQITDNQVIDAIKYHTTGRPNMTDLEKIIFVSDYIEEITRKMPEMVEARKIALKDLDLGVYIVLDNTIKYLKKNNKKVFVLTDDAHQYYLMKEKKNV